MYHLFKIKNACDKQNEIDDKKTFDSKKYQEIISVMSESLQNQLAKAEKIKDSHPDVYNDAKDSLSEFMMSFENVHFALTNFLKNFKQIDL